MQVGGSPILIQRCTFADNISAGNAGGLNVAAGQVTITDSTFSGNQANGSDGGGGIRHSGTGDILIRNSTFSGNSATNQGGAVLLAGTFSGTALVQNSTFANNHAATGGGIARSATKGLISLESTILSGNTATTSGPDIFTGGKVNVAD